MHLLYDIENINIEVQLIYLICEEKYAILWHCSFTRTAKHNLLHRELLSFKGEIIQ